MQLKIWEILSIYKLAFRLYHTLKGYVRYKTIISQNVSSKAQVKTFLFYKKVRPRSQDIHFFVFLIILWFTKSVTSWWVLVHETRCVFEYIIFEPQVIKSPNLAKLQIQTGKIIFKNLLNILEDWGWVPDPLQFNSLLQLLHNQLCQDSIVSFFWKGE